MARGQGSYLQKDACLDWLHECDATEVLGFATVAHVNPSTEDPRETYGITTSDTTLSSQYNLNILIVMFSNVLNFAL